MPSWFMAMPSHTTIAGNSMEVPPAMRKISDSQREIVDAAAKASAATNRAMNKQQTEDLLANLKDAGMTITEPDRAPFQEATSSVAESYRNVYGSMLDDLNAWLSSYNG